MSPTSWAKPAESYQRVHVQKKPAHVATGSEKMLGQTGITWNSEVIDWSVIREQPVDRARARLRASLSGFVWDAAALEGNTFTLPEVQTLLDGVTVGGKPLEDEKQVLALRDAFVELDAMVGGGTFRLDKATSDRLHGLLAPHEAIEAGHFRGEGQAKGGGAVSLGARGVYRATKPGVGGKILIDEHRALLNHIKALNDPREQALVYFAAATRRQFYFDGNKRLARLMMNGHLMAHGFDAISVSANRRIEFNEHLITLFDTGDATDLMAFIIDSRWKDADDD